MRWVIARVLPVPAPASTQTGPRTASATARCSGSSASSRLSGSIWTILPHQRWQEHWTGRERAGPGFCCTLGQRRKTTIGGTVPLTMYTTAWCGFCKNLKRQLAKAGVEITEVDIERDPEAAKFVE